MDTSKSSPSDNIVEDFISEPLDTMMIPISTKNGIQKIVSAMHIGFMEVKNYVHFRMPPLAADNTREDNLTAEEEEWLECMLFLEEDLHWLLRLPYYRFWSQVMYDENLHKCLESYLSQAPRSHDLDSLSLKDEILHVLQLIHKLVFLVYLRMSTYKESKENHMRPEVFGDIIYAHFIFDVPKIMDLCVLYGIQNHQLLSKMVSNIFITQPKYKDDLIEISQLALEAFSTVEEKLVLNENKYPDLQPSAFYDVINYITDTSATLHAFMEVYSPACEVFFQNNFLFRLAAFYEQVFPVVHNEIRNLVKKNRDHRYVEDVKRKVMLSKTFLVKIFRNILDYCCIQPILKSVCDKSSGECQNIEPTEAFLEVFTEIAVDKNFLHDYNELYPFETDLELLCEVDITLDPERLNYIFSSIYDTPGTFPENFVSALERSVHSERQTTCGIQTFPYKSVHNASSVLKSEKNDIDCLEAVKQDENVLACLIQEVRDVLPGSEEEFVEKCLEHYDFNVEKVIHAILSSSLPSEISKLDRSFNRKTEIEENSKIQDTTESSILRERRCVFDNDEYDMFSGKNINMECVHIGKRNKIPDNYEPLEKKESEFFKQLIAQYNSDDDEYDDTYDSAMVGLTEPEGESDSVKFYSCLPASFRRYEGTEEDENLADKTEPSSDDVNWKQKPGDFCINPEILREKASQRRISKMESRNRNKKGAFSEEQSNNSQQKDKHKAEVAKRSRRKQSDFKMSRGMVPFPTR